MVSSPEAKKLFKSKRNDIKMPQITVTIPKIKHSYPEIWRQKNRNDKARERAGD